jgi:glycerol-3-phosphate O-acyltransferase
METVLAEKQKFDPLSAVKAEIGPIGRALAAHYFVDVRFPPEGESQLRLLSEQGFVVHVMRMTAWVNYLYLAWALVKRGLPPIRAVVNLRRWFTRPWRKAAQRGDFNVRFTYARRHRGSALVFLKRSLIGSARGRSMREDPFPTLVALARKSDRPFYLVPELFVWERVPSRLKPNVADYVFGSPETPGFLHSMVAFWRNRRRAQFRVGEPIDLRQFVDQNSNQPDPVIARKVRSVLYHHLARETRAVFGPPQKPADRVIEEALRDRVLRRGLDEQAQVTGRAIDSLLGEARRNLKAIAARPSSTVTAMIAPLLHWTFNRIYDGIEVDEVGLDRAMRAASRAPMVLCPSHKSHIDYLIMSSVLWMHGYSVPLVAAGSNLSFFPLGPFLRRGGAFFLRRSFGGDRVYAASFKAYIKKLVRDRAHQEFFLEGGRSRTGKLLMPKLGMLTWEVEAVLEGARDDLYFVPVAIDYEKVVESASYSKELSGGEKPPENVRGLLSARKVLKAKYGRIHLRFEEPISLVDFMRTRGFDLKNGVGDEEKKGLVRALGNRIMYGISRASTLTPQALVSAALLAHRGRGVTAREVSERVGLLRRIAEEERCPTSATLIDVPSDPSVLGAIHDAMNAFITEGIATAEDVKGEPVYGVVEQRRLELSFYKNTLINLLAPRSLVANALLAHRGLVPLKSIQEDALFLSRLFKFEFIYKVGIPFEVLFSEAVESLVRMGLAVRTGESISVAPEPFAQKLLCFLADLLRDYLEAYLAASLAMEELSAKQPLDRRSFIKAAMETGRAEFLAGRINAVESLSKPTMENAWLFFLEQRRAENLRHGATEVRARVAQETAARIRSFLERSPST